jgi:predicted ATPase/class 3 adenylate cyclase
MPQPPSGTVTFLFSDIERSTELLQALGRGLYAQVIGEHHRVLRGVWSEHLGYEVDTAGDGFFVAFAEPSAALRAATEAQRALAATPWPEGFELRVRIGVHSGETLLRDQRYAGVAVHRAARICGAAHGGQVLVSQATADLCVDEALAGVELRDLGLHRLKDLPEPQRLYQLFAPGLPHQFPPPRTLSQTNLPRPALPLLGRDSELREVHELVREQGRRLLTITGAGGIGKTRFSLEVAGQLLEAFPDGAFFVSLAPLEEADLVIAAIVEALPVREQPGRSVRDLLAEFLASRRLLLVLDNFEHLLAAAPLIGGLLAAAPELVVLVTSREALHVAGECEYPLEPLADKAAAELFAARVSDRIPRFAIDESNRDAVATICHRLDGLPLALELAAARVKLLGIQGLVDRLDQRFELLSGERRDVPERQQTLRATIEWSYDLLSEREQRVLAALSVFAGGCTLESAKAVCDAELDTLGSLLDKSLLRRRETAEGDVRFWMLQTIREFGLECLRRTGGLNELRDRHLQYFRQLAARAEPQLRRAEQMSWLHRLDTEDQNLRSALTHGFGDAGDLQQAGELAVALIGFWDRRGRFSEAQGWLETMVARKAELAPLAAAWADLGLAAALARQGNSQQSLRLAAEAAEAFRAIGAPLPETRALDVLTTTLLNSREPRARARVEAAARRARDAARESDDPDAMVHALAVMSKVAELENDPARHSALLEDAARIRHEVGDLRGYGYMLMNIAGSAIVQAQFDRAETLLVEAIENARQVEDPGLLAFALSQLANAHLRQEHLDAAVPVVRETIVLAHDLGMNETLCSSLNAAALLAARAGNGQAAAELVGASEHFAQGLSSLASNYAAQARVATRGVLASRADDAIAKGRSLTAAAAVELALEVLTRTAPSSRSAPRMINSSSALANRKAPFPGPS